MPHLSVLEDLASEYGIFLKVCLYVVDDEQAANPVLMRELKSSKLPQFRFYPNEKTGSEKLEASYPITIPSGDHNEVR